MARYALIQAGAVANIIEADAAYAQTLGAVAAAGAAIGDLWDGAVFTRPAHVVPVPAVVTRRQAKQALALAGKLALVQPAIDAIADATQRGLIQIEWDDSLNFERTRPSLIMLATGLGLSSADLDNLFILAGGLE